MKNFIQPGSTLTLTAPAGGVVGGTGYKIGQLFVVAVAAADATDPFEGQVDGVFELPKTTGATWSEGELLYWDDSTKKVTTVAAGNLQIGCAVTAELSGDTVGAVRLNATAKADGVSDDELEDDSVDTAAIQDDAVTTAKIDDLAVTAAKLAADAVETAKILNANVTTAKLADDAVTQAKSATFFSVEVTATGAEQDVAHGLGVVPAAVLIAPQSHPGVPDTGAFDIAEGAHDVTNVKFTATADLTVKILVWA